MFALAAVALFGLTGAANAATAMLASDDFVGISFWVIAMGMAAATVSSSWKEILLQQAGKLQ